MQLKGKKILVTGGAGFIGFHLTKKLLELGADVTIFDNMSNSKMENVTDNPKAAFVKADILDLKQLLSLPSLTSFTI
jgi:UDP-glucose 4-epimerase